jgi:hypothetical protein
MNNHCQPYQGRAVPLNRHFKYPAPTRAPGHRELWRSGARQSMKHALRRARLCRGNWDANPLFPKAVPGIIAAASAFCGWRHQGQLDNQMTAQHGSKSESVKRHHTAKRMILLFLLRCRMRLDSNDSGARWNPVILVFVSNK